MQQLVATSKPSFRRRFQDRFKSYLYSQLGGYFSFFLDKSSRVVIVDPQNNYLVARIKAQVKVFFTNPSSDITSESEIFSSFQELRASRPEYLILNGNLHSERDIQTYMDAIREVCTPSTRILISYYSGLWKPLFALASKVGLQTKSRESNWISPQDFTNFMKLSDFEIVSSSQRILMPIYIPFISWFVNRWVAPLPIFSLFSLLNIAVVKTKNKSQFTERPSVSIVVAARNEAGNIESMIQRIPKMGDDDELIIVEGNSKDDTWAVIQEMQKKYLSTNKIVIAQQESKGKGDAVRKGFNLASKEILMILDADLTVPPEDLPKFYQAIASGKGEFINGSRLVYAMDKEAMRFLNMLGNKFFAAAFSFVLGQPFKDTLCGTKVLSRAHYTQIANNRSYFGDFDPFGDFDLLFGAARSGLKILELPIRYRERTYGETNISRFTHGWLLLRMVIFAARKIKFV